MLSHAMLRCLWLLLAAAAAIRAAAPPPKIDLPLAGNFHPTAPRLLDVAVTGLYRFVKVEGKVGYQALSRETALRIATTLHRGAVGTISVWVSPLEDLGVAANPDWVAKRDHNAQTYALIADGLPANDPAKTTFAWCWRSGWHPQMVAKFVAGDAKAKSDFTLVPYVMAEHLPLHKNRWYQFTLTWNRNEHRLRLYVNGILCGTTDYPFDAAARGDALYLGNTAMIFAGLRIYDTELPAEEARGGPPTDDATRAELLDLFTVRPRPAADWHPDSHWYLAGEYTFTHPGDLKGWTQQGCLPPHPIKQLRITSEGLLIETPEEIALETRTYLWSPRDYEGDLAVQMDFRPEKDSGLALMVFQASGMQREDFLTDQPPRTTGSMATIIADTVRNYHWEFFRRTGDVRADLGTQVLVKNPWQRPLGMSTLPRMKVGQWHQLLFVQEGTRLRCAIDGAWALDVKDDPFTNNGPVFNFGRIGIRLMYNTRMRFRNLRIWNRNEGVQVVE